MRRMLSPVRCSRKEYNMQSVQLAASEIWVTLIFGMNGHIVKPIDLKSIADVLDHIFM